MGTDSIDVQSSLSETSSCIGGKDMAPAFVTVQYIIYRSLLLEGK
jgi:hypothetical protein